MPGICNSRVAGSAVEVALLDVDVPELEEDVAEPLVADEPLDPDDPPVVEELPVEVPELEPSVLTLLDCCFFS